MTQLSTTFQAAAPFLLAGILFFAAWTDIRTRTVPLALSWAAFLIGLVALGLQFEVVEQFHYPVMMKTLKTPDLTVIILVGAILAVSFAGLFPPTDARLSVAVLGVFGLAVYTVAILASAIWILVIMLRRKNDDDQLGAPFAAPSFLASALALTAFPLLL